MKTAAALCFAFLCPDGKTDLPPLDEMRDDRWSFEILRALQGGQVHLAMLAAFSSERDYTETLRLAKHLSQPLFDGYNYQERAKELAAQLPLRLDDFKTFTLPSAPEWQTISAGLPREKQVEYLASHLRLLNCFQAGQPGGVDYTDSQYRIAGPRWDDENEQSVKDAEVINPSVLSLQDDAATGLLCGVLRRK